jgi:hypothetical protein
MVVWVGVVNLARSHDGAWVRCCITAPGSPGREKVHVAMYVFAPEKHSVRIFGKEMARNTHNGLKDLSKE